MAINTGWTPEPTQRQRIMNLAAQVDDGAIFGAVGYSDGDPDKFESFLLGAAYAKCNERNQAAMRLEQLADERNALTEELKESPYSWRVDEIFERLTEIGREEDEITGDISYAEDDQRDAAMRAGKFVK